MTLAGWLEIALVLAAVAAAAWPLGDFIAAVFEGRATFLTPVLAPLERRLYAVAGVNPDEGQEWLAYTFSILVFSFFCFLTLYLIQRCQAFLPFNPQARAAVAPDLA